MEEFAAIVVQNRFQKNLKQYQADSLKVDFIDGLLIREYLGFLHQKNKKATIARKLSAIRSFFKYLVKQGVLADNPTQTILTPKQEKPIPTYLPIDDMFRLLDSIETDTLLGLRNRAIFETLYSCGIRVSELAGLNLLDVDFNSGVIRVLGKGGQQRIVPIGKKAADTIKNYRKRLVRKSGLQPDPNGPLFLNKNYGRLTSRSIARILEKFAKSYPKSEKKAAKKVVHKSRKKRRKS